MNDPKNRQNSTLSVDFVVEKAELQKIDLNLMLSDTTSVDCIDLYRIFSKQINVTKSELRQSLQLLSELTNYHVEPSHRTAPFKPMLVWTDRRTLVPCDILPAQIDVLAEYLPSVTNAGLKARIADVVWFVKRERQDIAELAVSAYCACLDQVWKGTATLAFNNHSPWSDRAMELVIRAATISRATKWKLTSSKLLRELIRELVSTAYNENKPEDFVRIANVEISHGASPRLKKIIAWSEDLVGSDALLTTPDRRMDLWEVAARCYRKMRDKANSNRCMIEIAECFVQRAEAAGSSMLTANFFHRAIEVFRNCPDTKERREELGRKLRQVQPSILDEMGTVSTEVDLTKLVNHHVASVRGKSLPQAFRTLVMCCHPPEPDDIRQDAETYVKEMSLLHSMAPGEAIDFQGRVMFRSPGLTENAEERELHFLFLMSRNRDLPRYMAANGAIIPIRAVISEEHFASVDVVQKMIKNSPLIPAERIYIFARAIVQFFAGEDVEAVSLLVPQLENSLRHILSLVGIDTTTPDENGLQTEASLSKLLNPKNRWRLQLEKILTQRHIHEIDILFNFAGGPAIRNQIAHGKVPAGGFWNHNMVYASWLIIRLAVIPLIKEWGNTD